MRFISVCSGIEAASVALEPLGFVPAGFAEIDKGAAKVLAHRFGSNMPSERLAENGVPNHGDFTLIDPSAVGRVDLLIGGTPCQGFSVAGLRNSLADIRSNLALAFVVLAHGLAEKADLRNVLWENVPGVLNTPDNAFGCFLGGLVGHNAAFPQPRGAGWPRSGMVRGPRARAAWRVLDAQYFGLAQRRERVFVVADFGNGADPAKVLFERQGVHGNTAPSREAREGIAEASAFGISPDCFDRDGEGAGGTAGERSGLGIDRELAYALRAKRAGAVAFGGNNQSGPIDVATAVNAHGGPHGRQDFESETFVVNEGSSMGVTHALRGEGFDASEDGTGRGTPIVAELADTLTAHWERSKGAKAGNQVGLLNPINESVFAFDTTQITSPISRANPKAGDPCHTLSKGSHAPAVAFDMRGREDGAQFEGPHDTANIRAASGGSSRSYVAQQWAVRRLTPLECERLQGFPDGWTDIPGAADGPRYKQLGNSFAVSVISWLGKRLKDGLESK